MNWWVLGIDENFSEDQTSSVLIGARLVIFSFHYAFTISLIDFIEKSNRGDFSL